MKTVEISIGNYQKNNPIINATDRQVAFIRRMLEKNGGNDYDEIITHNGAYQAEYRISRRNAEKCIKAMVKGYEIKLVESK